MRRLLKVRGLFEGVICVSLLTSMGFAWYVAYSAMKGENQCLRNDIEVLNTLKAVTTKLKETRALLDQCETDRTADQEWCAEHIQTLDASLFVEEALDELDKEEERER